METRHREISRCVTNQARKVLIYRLGSLGDTVVALPCFHLVARSFPEAERRVLTNVPVDSRAPALSSVLDGSGLVHSYFSYPIGTRAVDRLARLRRGIGNWRPDVVVYLTARASLAQVLRDVLFFRAAGVRKIVGLPWSRDIRTNRWIPHDGGYFEPEASRLARALSPLGDARLAEPANWDLILTDAEKSKADEVLGLGRTPFLACSVGTKVEVKDWGVPRWRELLSRLGRRYRTLPLVMVGSSEEAHLSEAAARGWSGHVLNLCGRLTPRETAAVLARSVAFIGHDSGPMHLAAAAGVPCTAVFSARAHPRIWYPWGDDHRVVQHSVPCQGCRLEKCVSNQKKCINSITVDEVEMAARAMLEEVLN
jgi:heptosyltransferase-3